MQSNGEKAINKTLLMQRCLLMDQRVIEKDERNIYYAVIFVFSQSVTWRYLLQNKVLP